MLVMVRVDAFTSDEAIKKHVRKLKDFSAIALGSVGVRHGKLYHKNKLMSARKNRNLRLCFRHLFIMCCWTGQIGKASG